MICTCGTGAPDPMSHFGDCPVRAWGEEQMYAEEPDPEWPQGAVRNELSALRFLLGAYGFEVVTHEEPVRYTDGSTGTIGLRVARPETLARVLARAVERLSRGLRP